MMKVNDYLVKWKYDAATLEFDGEFEFREITNCDIFDKNRTLVSTGNAILNPRDTMDKNTARKITLSRALEIFTKQERKEFWEVYRTSTIIPRWETKN